MSGSAVARRPPRQRIGSLLIIANGFFITSIYGALGFKCFVPSSFTLPAFSAIHHKKRSSFFPDFKPIKKIIIHTNRGKHGGDYFNRSHKDPASSRIQGQGHMTVGAGSARCELVAVREEESHMKETTDRCPSSCQWGEGGGASEKQTRRNQI